MALTRSDWTVDTVYRNGRKFIRGSCNIAQTSSEKAAFTKAITFLRPDKKFGIFANMRAASMDGSTLPLDVIGTTYTTDDYASMDLVEESSLAILTHNGSAVGSSGILIGGVVKAGLIADIKAAQAFVVFDPKNTASHAELPTIYLNANGAGALTNTKTTYWNVIQAID